MAQKLYTTETKSFCSEIFLSDFSSENIIIVENFVTSQFLVKRERTPDYVNSKM